MYRECALSSEEAISSQRAYPAPTPHHQALHRARCQVLPATHLCFWGTELKNEPFIFMSLHLNSDFTHMYSVLTKCFHMHYLIQCLWQPCQVDIIIFIQHMGKLRARKIKWLFQVTFQVTHSPAAETWSEPRSCPITLQLIREASRHWSVKPSQRKSHWTSNFSLKHNYTDLASPSEEWNGAYHMGFGIRQTWFGNSCTLLAGRLSKRISKWASQRWFLYILKRMIIKRKQSQNGERVWWKQEKSVHKMWRLRWCYDFKVKTSSRQLKT